MNLRTIDWIWHVRGVVELAPGQSPDDAFARLDPVFQQTGTSHDRHGNTLTFHKKDPASQDPMAVFNSGTLVIADDAAGPMLRYDLISRSLLACFLAPLLFLGAAQLTIELNKRDTPAAGKDGKADDEKKKPEKVMVLHPIDKALGAPEPEKPKKKDPKKKDEGGDKKLKPTPAYVFAGIFAALYIIGRLLEAWLVNRLFRKHLAQT